MKKTATKIFLACFLAAFALQAAEPLQGIKILAVVGNEVITSFDLSEAKKNLAKSFEFQQSGADLKNDETVLNFLIDQKLIDKEIKSKEIEITDSEIADSVSRTLREAGLTKKEYEEKLAKEGSSFAQFVKEVEQQIKRGKFAQQYIYSNISFSEADLKKYYEQFVSKFIGYKVIQFKQILMLPDDPNNATQIKTLFETAEKLAAGLKKGGSFEASAKRHDRGPWAGQGSLSPELNSAALDPDLAQELVHLKPGEVAGPIATDRGLHIVKLVKKSEPYQEPFEKVRNFIEKQAYQQKVAEAYNNYITLLRRKSYVDIRL